MRPPRCFIRYLTAAIEAQHELIMSLDADGRVQLDKAAAACRAVKELREHVDGCEECETP